MAEDSIFFCNVLQIFFTFLQIICKSVKILQKICKFSANFLQEQVDESEIQIICRNIADYLQKPKNSLCIEHQPIKHTKKLGDIHFLKTLPWTKDALDEAEELSRGTR